MSLRSPLDESPMASRPSLFGLAPGGVCHAVPVARDAGRSYRSVSPLPAGPAGSRQPSCAGGLFSVALSRGLPPPAVSRHRTPMEPGLSSVTRAQRPSSCLTGIALRRRDDRVKRPTTVSPCASEPSRNDACPDCRKIPPAGCQSDQRSNSMDSWPPSLKASCHILDHCRL